MDFDELQRAFFDGLYGHRIELAIAALVATLILGVIAWRAGWLEAARRHPARSGVVVAGALVVGLPLAWYLLSPLWIRTELVEPGPAVILDAADTIPSPATATTFGKTSAPTPGTTMGPSETPVTGTPAPTPFAARRVSTGAFHGTDEFHFGRGTASIIETAPGRFTLRLDDFSVRNGPDLFVYLSPAADDYAKGAFEVGRLKATDGAFGYELTPGVDPARFASVIIWCKQFSHLFAVAPLESA
jgi:hypothetical protein